MNLFIYFYKSLYCRVHQLFVTLHNNIGVSESSVVNGSTILPQYPCFRPANLFYCIESWF